MRVKLYGLVVLLVTAFGAIPGQSQPLAPKIEELMSAQQFRQAGLTKLSPEELQQLNAWLSTYTRAIAQAAAGGPGDPSGDSAGAASAVVESRIDGEFTGWEGETIFKLQNGQIWQQAAYAYKYKYAYSPKVLIYNSGGVFRMKVDGVEDSIPVRRLK